MVETDVRHIEYRGKVYQFWTKLYHSKDSQLVCVEGSNSLSCLSVTAPPEGMALDVAQYLQQELGSPVQYAQTAYLRGDHAPEARGIFFLPERDISNIIIASALAHTDVYIRNLQGRHAIGTKLSIHPQSVDLLLMLKAYHSAVNHTH